MDRAKNLETILTLCVALVIFFLIFQVRALLFAAVALGLTGMFSNYLSGAIAKAWMKLAEVLGFISSRILLSAIYFAVLVPVALLSRLFSKHDKLQLKKKNTGSYFAERNHRFIPKDFENMW